MPSSTAAVDNLRKPKLSVLMRIIVPVVEPGSREDVLGIFRIRRRMLLPPDGFNAILSRDKHAFMIGRENLCCSYLVFIGGLQKET